MENDTTPKYKYAPLPGPSHIRLLRLHTRANAEALLSGSLIVRDLDASGHQYTTISYSWGRNSDGFSGLTHEILIDGRTRAITENLHDGLIQLSKPGSEIQELWVDAICINQDDAHERSTQVSIMGSIYQRASSLVIWLGYGSVHEDLKAAEGLLLNEEGTGLTGPMPGQMTIPSPYIAPTWPTTMSKVQTLAFRVAFDLADRFNPEANDPPYRGGGLPSNFENWLWPRLLRYALAGLGASEVCQLLLEDVDASRLLMRRTIVVHLLKALHRTIVEHITEEFQEMYVSFMKLCSRRYFMRRWVMQEIFHSHPEYICLRWGVFAIRLTELIDRHNHMHTLLYSAYNCLCYEGAWVYLDIEGVSKRDWHRAFNALHIRHMKNETNIGVASMVVLIHEFRETSCADDRDLVYAFLSLTTELESLRVDYSRSAEELFHALATTLVQNGMVDDVLCTAAEQFDYGFRQQHIEQSTTLPSWVPDLKCRVSGAYTTVQTYHHDAPNMQPIISADGKCLTIQTKVGKVEGPVTLESGEILEVAYLCQLSNLIEFNHNIVLRALGSLPDHFVLAGFWRQSTDETNLWESCFEISTRMVRLY